MPPETPQPSLPLQPQAPAPSPSAAAPAVASTPTPTSPVTAPTPTSPPVVDPAKRPEYVPETFWDAAGGKVKEKEFSDHLNGLTTRVAAEDSRKLSLPATPGDYKVEIPQDFKPPAGIEFKFDDADPVLAEARNVAHALGISQEGFSKLLGLYASAQVNSASQVQAAQSAEIAKLGPTGPARVTAIETFFGGILGNPDEGKRIAARMFTADDVTRMEKVVARFASQGGALFSQQHRDHAPPRMDSAAYEKLTYSEKKEYAAKFSNGQQPNA